MLLEWNNKESLKSHLSKHIIEKTKEQDIWKKNFNEINEYLDNQNFCLLKNKYETISLNNAIQGNSHYLYKDTNSQKFSINFYKVYDDDYLTTCTRYIGKELKIFSCFFKNKCKTNLDIFLSVNNLKFENIENKSMKIFDYKSYRVDAPLNKFFLKACVKANVQNPTKKEQEILTIYRLCILIEYLKYSSKKQEELFYENKTKIKNIILYEILLKIFEYKYNILIGKEKKLENFNEEEIREINFLTQDVNNCINDNLFYSEDKLFIDLLAEFINLFNYMSKNNKKILIENSVWQDMFMSFK